MCWSLPAAQLDPFRRAAVSYESEAVLKSDDGLLDLVRVPEEEFSPSCRWYTGSAEENGLDLATKLELEEKKTGKRLAVVQKRIHGFLLMRISSRTRC